MSAQSLRGAGGRIDRSRTLTFTFDGRRYEGHPGDTLASALIANGVRLVGRSFKYHRPRGIVSAGSEEPNALVTLGAGAAAVTNTRATVVPLEDGLAAASQNAWPSLRFDLGALAGLFAPLIPAGFYYKTFLGSSARWTRLYEPAIRHMAGLGPAPVGTDPDRYDKRHVTCDVLVVGAGAAGLAAARAAAANGARTVLVDEQSDAGGGLRGADDRIESIDGWTWAQSAAAAFRGQPDCLFLPLTTAFGCYDHGLVMAVQRAPTGSLVRERLWQIRARRIILATGAHEQPELFGDNDRPGVMLASAVRTYARHYGVIVGHRVLVPTGDDHTASALADAGAEVAMLPAGKRVLRAMGRGRVQGALVGDENGSTQRVACDAIAMSRGWQPAVHLHSQAGGKTLYCPERDCFVPVLPCPGIVSIGGCAGQFDIDAAVEDGEAAGIAAANGTETPAQAPVVGQGTAAMRPVSGVGTAFVDFQNDVTGKDIALAHREGFVAVEHLKRYTTTGMATDQGKLSNLNSLRLMAAHRGIAPGAVGTTTFRPPYTPVSFGALAGIERGDLLDPIRTTPMHDWHVVRGAAFEPVGQWMRPWYYPVGAETMDQAVRRECRAVRNGIGMLDASTLGKIELRGRDVPAFLELVYTNAWKKLGVGRCRYGVMCGEDGMVMDDGVTARIADDRWIMFTTTGNAARVLDHLEDLLQTEWPHLEVYLTSVTDHWSASVVTGPKARAVVEKTVTGIDFGNEAFPHLAMREGRVADASVRVYRISFTGELSYEVHAPALHGAAVWDALFTNGEPHDVTPYGTETMHVLRAEKGYIIIGQDTDGTVTPLDLGLNWAIAGKKPDFVGKRSLARADCRRPDRKQLVGLVPIDHVTRIEEGGQLVEAGTNPRPPCPMLGHVTSAYWSEALGHPFALALLKGGSLRHGDVIDVHMLDGVLPCRVTPPIFVDPEGSRLDG